MQHISNNILVRVFCRKRDRGSSVLGSNASTNACSLATLAKISPGFIVSSTWDAHE
jgi:hypothetical protein